MSQYLRRSVLFLCVFYLCLVIFPGKQQNRTYSNQDKGTADRTGKENVQTPVRQHQCPAEVFLSQRPQHNAEQNGNQLKIHPAQEIRYNAEDQDDVDIIHPVIGGIRTRNAKGQYNSRQNLVGNTGDMRVKTGKATAQNIHKHIDHDQAHHNGI